MFSTLLYVVYSTTFKIRLLHVAEVYRQSKTNSKARLFGSVVLSITSSVGIKSQLERLPYQRGVLVCQRRQKLPVYGRRLLSSFTLMLTVQDDSTGPAPSLVFFTRTSCSEEGQGMTHPKSIISHDAGIVHVVGEIVPLDSPLEPYGSGGLLYW